MRPLPLVVLCSCAFMQTLARQLPSKAFLLPATLAHSSPSSRSHLLKPLMLFGMFGSQAPDPATNIAAKPAMSKTKTDEEWKKILTPTQYKVLRLKATEPRGVTVAKGGWDDHFEKGTYVCAGCKTPLYTSEHKFDCGCQWPGFWTNIKNAVMEERDADGFRCEILCAECGGHLGHVFRGEGFRNPPPNERHCVNGVSIAFVPEGKDVSEAIPATYTGPVYGP